MARIARPAAYQPLFADSDSDGEGNSDVEVTPRAKRTKGKKRVSDVYQPIADADGSSPHRVPFTAVNINDDEAEKRKRRRSAKQVQPMVQMVVDESNPGSQSQDGANTGDTPKASRHSKHKQQLIAVAETPVINVPLDVMSSNFEEWMKMATDNKINATNSWNFALIDYFHDMSLLRNDLDNSINFQKASCTLDGCVKIWTSRVDSVGTETGKLLSNLASEGKADADEGELSDNPDSNDPSQRKRASKPHRAESTLAKNVSQLRSKKLDLEFSVDPLFKKTCADFDEGGAQGLLMNHLSLGVGSEGSMRVIFDASDSMGKSKEDDEEEAEVEPYDEIDLANICNDFLPDLSVLEDKAIAHSLRGFSFSKENMGFDTSNFINTTYDDDDDDDNGGFGGDDIGAAMDVDGAFGSGGDGAVQDFFVGDQAVGDDYGGGFDADLGDQSPMDGEPSPVGDDGFPVQQPARTGGFEPFEPGRAPNERDLILAMTEPGANGSSLDYFDQTFLKNWAGPEHWKLRKVIRRPEANADVTANKSKQREKKEPFKIDFLTPSTKSQKEIAREIFAPVTRGGSITLPQFSKKKGRKGKEKEKQSEQTLPDDMHFSSRQLVTLFLKPKFALRMRGNRARLNENDGEVDENFWAQAAADQAAGRRGEDGEDITNGGAIPFNTQFFHDEYDDGPGFDDIYDGDGDGMAGGDNADIDAEAGERDLLSETQGQSRRVRPETVNYARRAKRVDVRKLKDNIWKGLDIIVPPSQGTEDESGDLNMEVPPTDPGDARVFTNVISDLHSTYPKEKMDEISTSFCFICLLHLANERGLKLEVGDEDEGVAPINTIEETEETKVGNIWGLKVFRDPTAIPSA
ncbi:hypothetical protein M0805_005838 [Coniferiporia weirii]|nr:hypothetical protein M0805_005838 [Coniferiporia weirii]